MKKRTVGVLWVMVMMISLWSVLVQAATLKWDPVADNPECVIINYTVYAIPAEGGSEKNYNVGMDLELAEIEQTLNLIPNIEYQFYVTAWSTTKEGQRQVEPLLWTYVVETVDIPENNVGETVIIIPCSVKTLIIQNGL